MWWEYCQVDFNYYIWLWWLCVLGGWCEFDEVVGEIVSILLNCDYLLWEMYFVEGFVNYWIVVVVKIYYVLVDGVVLVNMMVWGMDLLLGLEVGCYVFDFVFIKWQLLFVVFIDYLCYFGWIFVIIWYIMQGLGWV